VKAPDNLAFVDAVVDEALAPLVTRLEEERQATLRVCVESSVGHADYLQERLLRALSAESLRVLLCRGDLSPAVAGTDTAQTTAGGAGRAAALGAEWRLDLDLLDLRLRYDSRGGFFSPGRTRRFADVAFSATLADDHGVLRLQERYAAAAADEVESSNLTALDRGPFPAETAGEPAPGFWAPVVAVGVALGMTFLLIGTHNDG
jgi:hypothetical protein